MPKQPLILVIALMASHFSFGQRQWMAFRFTEENEFFNITQRGIDRYYTQGMRFEFLYHTSKRNLFEKLLIPVSASANTDYSISVAQQIHTPKKTDDYFFAGDMPYAGTLVFSQMLQSTDSSNQFRVTTKLDAGMIGPSALAKGTQLLFHKIINNDLAVGWSTQLRNDIYLNYLFRAEKSLLKPEHFFRVEGKGELNFGTALISLASGINMEIGNWYNPTKKFSWQLFFRPEVRLVLFNALLQGGILNQVNANEFYSQYFIDKIKPLVYSHSSGFRIRYNKFELFYRQVNVTREFTGQQPHYFSTLMFTFPLAQTGI